MDPEKLALENLMKRYFIYFSVGNRSDISIVFAQPTQGIENADYSAIYVAIPRGPSICICLWMFRG
jgi:uncharacterized protein YfaA (DUF2138 family)